MSNIDKVLEICINGVEIKICLQPFFTMIDGKVCNALTNCKSTLSCNVCLLPQKFFGHCSPSEYLELEIGEKEVENLAFGVPILHAHIKFLEFIFDIACKLDSNYNQETDKEKISTKKKEIQVAAKEKLGLLLSVPKPGIF